MSDPDPSKGSGPDIFMNLNLNIGSGPCVNPVRRVREPDRGQSTSSALALVPSGSLKATTSDEDKPGVYDMGGFTQLGGWAMMRGV